MISTLVRWSLTRIPAVLAALLTIFLSVVAAWYLEPLLDESFESGPPQLEVAINRKDFGGVTVFETSAKNSSDKFLEDVCLIEPFDRDEVELILMRTPEWGSDLTQRETSCADDLAPSARVEVLIVAKGNPAPPSAQGLFKGRYRIQDGHQVSRENVVVLSKIAATQIWVDSVKRGASNLLPLGVGLILVLTAYVLVKRRLNSNKASEVDGVASLDASQENREK